MTAPSRLFPIILLALVLGVSVPAAEARTMREKMQTACAPDVAALCPDVASDEDRLKACLIKARARVSAACMAMVDASE